MNLNNWQDTSPGTGTFTVLSVTTYSSGESEATATTVKDCVIKRKKKIDIESIHEQLLESSSISGEEALNIIEEFTEPKREKTELEIKENKDRSMRRTKSQIRKKIIEGELDHFLTLTYKENKKDVKACWLDWKRFIRKVTQKYPNLKYLVIIERQKRGAIHFHAAVHGYMHANTMRALWLSVVGQGNIDIQRRKHNQSLHNLAKYITKYLTKQQNELDDFKNLYRCSRNIKLNVIKFYLPKEFAFIRPEMIREALLFWVKDIKQKWDDSNGLYSCTWVSSLAQ